MLHFLSNTPELRAKPASASEAPACMEPSEYEFGMLLNTSTFSGNMFQLSVKHNADKKVFLAITSHQILEIVQNSVPSNANTNTTYYIHGVHQLSSLDKIQFRRGVSITFQFKSGLTKSYRMPEAVGCCEYLKRQMKSAGLQAQHSSPCIDQQVITGCELLETVYQLEERFSLEPSFRLLEAMMALLRQAVECLGEAQDSRFQCALQHMRRFLTRADVVQLLDEHESRKNTSKEEKKEEGSVKIKVKQNMQEEDVSYDDDYANDKNKKEHNGIEISEEYDESARLEKELYDLIGSLNEELNSLVVSDSKARLRQSKNM